MSLKTVFPTHLSRLVLILIATSFLGADLAPAATGDPLPGVDILIKRKPGKKPTLHFGSADLPAIPADFFFPGSPPFSGSVELEGPCGDIPAPCADGRVDFVEGATPNVLEVEMLPMTLTGTEPVSLPPGPTPDVFFDIIVDAHEGLPPGEPVVREVRLPPGIIMTPGTSTFIVESHISIMCDISFVETGTGNPAGSILSVPMQLHLTSIDAPIVRLLSPNTSTVMGFDGVNNDGVAYLSSGGGMEFYLESHIPESPVNNESRSFGQLKARF